MCIREEVLVAAARGKLRMEPHGPAHSRHFMNTCCGMTEGLGRRGGA